MRRPRGYFFSRNAWPICLTISPLTGIGTAIHQALAAYIAPIAFSQSPSVAPLVSPITSSVAGLTDLNISPLPCHLPSKQAPRLFELRPSSSRNLYLWELLALRVILKSKFIQNLLLLQFTPQNNFPIVRIQPILLFFCILPKIEQNIQMKKDSKKYNLAFKDPVPQPHPHNPIPNVLNMISQVPQTNSLQQISIHNRRPINMFEIENNYKSQRLADSSPYSVLCRGEVEAYKKKIKKIKNTGVSGMLRLKVSDSFLSSSRHTGTFAELSNNNQCLTKEELGQFYKKTKQCQQKQRPNKSLQKTKQNTTLRVNKTLLNTTTNTSQLPELYTSLTSRRSPFPSSTKFSVSSKKMLHEHRKKVEELDRLTIRSERENIQPWSWSGNLRDVGGLTEMFEGKYVEKIQRGGLRLRGFNKLEKEYVWIGERKNQLYEAIQGKAKFVKKPVQTVNKDFNQAQSRITNINEI